MFANFNQNLTLSCFFLSRGGNQQRKHWLLWNISFILWGSGHLAGYHHSNWMWIAKVSQFLPEHSQTAGLFRRNEKQSKLQSHIPLSISQSLAVNRTDYKWALWVTLWRTQYGALPPTDQRASLTDHLTKLISRRLGWGQRAARQNSLPGWDVEVAVMQPEPSLTPAPSQHDPITINIVCLTPILPLMSPPVRGKCPSL